MGLDRSGNADRLAVTIAEISVAERGTLRVHGPLDDRTRARADQARSVKANRDVATPLYNLNHPEAFVDLLLGTVANRDMWLRPLLMQDSPSLIALLGLVTYLH